MSVLPGHGRYCAAHRADACTRARLYTLRYFAAFREFGHRGDHAFGIGRIDAAEVLRPRARRCPAAHR